MVVYRVFLARVLSIYIVEHYGAKGDGVTDDTAAIQAAIDAASEDGGGKVVFKARTYRITGSLNGAEYVKLEGAGMDATTLLFDDVAGSGYGLQYNRAHKGYAAMAADVAIGDKTVTVEADGGANWSAGDWIFLYDAVAYNGRFCGRVESVAGDVVTLEEQIPFPYTAATSGRAYYFDTGSGPVRGAHIADMTLEVDVATNVCATNRDNLIRLQRCEGGTIERVRLRKGKTFNLYLNDCRGVTTRACTSELSGNMGAGFAAYDSTACTFEGNMTRKTPFGFTCAGSAYITFAVNTVTGRNEATQGRGIKVENSCHAVVSGNHISDTILYGIYISDSWCCTVGGNTLFGCGKAAGEQGIQLGGYLAGQTHHNTVVGNTIRKTPNYGIICNNTGGGATATCNTIQGNNIYSCGGAMWVETSQNLIMGNVIDGINNGIYVPNLAGSNTIVGNQFLNVVNWAIKTDTGAGSNYVKTNNVNGETVTTHATDTYAA